MSHSILEAPPAALPLVPAVNTPTLRIAVASRDGSRVDLHFGQTEAFRVFDVSAQGALAVESRDLASHAQGDENSRDTICRMLSDCKVVLVAKVGVAPQEKLAKAGIDATDRHGGEPVEAALAAVFAAKTAPACDTPVDAASFQLSHVMLRVTDLDRSVDFYTRMLGMRVLERRDHKKNQFSQAYLGYGDGFARMVLELVFNWTREEPYRPGDTFGHIAVQVTGIVPLCDRLAAAGVAMPRPPRAQQHGEAIVAFIEDPDGHRIELMQRCGRA
ncbi:MAG: VOC family protein [Azospirillaceae bacterium]|nr:VOC family protein [Azospirillaceae bacterium]